jgi:hypothetical protein
MPMESSKLKELKAEKEKILAREKVLHEEMAVQKEIAELKDLEARVHPTRTQKITNLMGKFRQHLRESKKRRLALEKKRGY